jgi:hypothetical protein
MQTPKIQLEVLTNQERAELAHLLILALEHEDVATEVAWEVEVVR